MASTTACVHRCRFLPSAVDMKAMGIEDGQKGLLNAYAAEKAPYALTWNSTVFENTLIRLMEETDEGYKQTLTAEKIAQYRTTYNEVDRFETMKKMRTQFDTWLRNKSLNPAMCMCTDLTTSNLTVDCVRKPTVDVAAPDVVTLPKAPTTGSEPVRENTPYLDVVMSNDEQNKGAERIPEDLPSTCPVINPDEDLIDIQTLYGYDKVTNRYAVQFKGHDSFIWLFKDQMTGIDRKWLAVAEKQGQPAFDYQLKKYRSLKGGVLTRRSIVTASHVVSGALVRYNMTKNLACMTASYLNLAHDRLSPEQIKPLVDLEISETMLANKLCSEGYPVRMSHPLKFTGPPKSSGDYLISLHTDHVDGLRVLENGAIQFFSSNKLVSQVVLSEKDKFVKKHIIERTEPYIAIKLQHAKKSQLSKAERRYNAKKRKRVSE